MASLSVRGHDCPAVILSVVIYLGLLLALVGFLAIVKPIRWLRLSTRRKGLGLLVAGVLIATIGMMLPASESRIGRRVTRLDDFVPVWQFREVHSVDVAAPPAQVWDAIHRVRADEIHFFRTLTWIRRGGRALPTGILNANQEPMIDIALKGGFVRLADDPPRELVIGTVVVAPPGTHGTLTPEVFRRNLPPGFALAAMNFLVLPHGDRTRVITETRVFANSPAARRGFAAYWRLIYPGSAIIRRMWLRAIKQKTEPRKSQILLVPPFAVQFHEWPHIYRYAIPPIPLPFPYPHRLKMQMRSIRRRVAARADVPDNESLRNMKAFGELIRVVVEMRVVENVPALVVD